MTGVIVCVKVDLKARKVTTLVGTGQQAGDHQDGKIGVKQATSSPWDVCIASLPGEWNVLQ